MINYNTTQTVQEISKINISGNIIPEMWYLNLRKITKRDDTPYFEAIIILSEIVYWYRWREVRDEESGMITSYNKKFKADMLQKSYKDLSKKFGLKKSTVKAAIDFLVKNNVIKREFRNISTKSGIPLSNVMFLEPISETIKNITFLPPEEYKKLHKTNKNDGHVLAIPLDSGGTLPLDSGGTLPLDSGGTYTKTTHTETTHTKNTYSSPLREREEENLFNENIKSFPLKEKDVCPDNISLYKVPPEPAVQPDGKLRILCNFSFKENRQFIYDFMTTQFFIHHKIQNRDKYLHDKLKKWLDMFTPEEIIKGVRDVLDTDPGVVYEKYVRIAVSKYRYPVCEIQNKNLIYVCNCGKHILIDTDEVGDCEYCNREIDADVINKFSNLYEKVL